MELTLGLGGFVAAFLMSAFGYQPWWAAPLESLAVLGVIYLCVLCWSLVAAPIELAVGQAVLIKDLRGKVGVAQSRAKKLRLVATQVAQLSTARALFDDPPEVERVLSVIEVAGKIMVSAIEEHRLWGDPLSSRIKATREALPVVISTIS